MGEVDRAWLAEGSVVMGWAMRLRKAAPARAGREEPRWQWVANTSKWGCL